MRIEIDGLSLGDLAKRLRGVSRLEISEALAEETIGLIQDGFIEGHAPDGTPWLELAIRDGQPLRDTGGLMAAWARGEVSAAAFEVVNSKNYSPIHQGGSGIYGPKKTKILPIKGAALKIPGLGFRASVKGTPARPMVPDGELPQPWADRYDEAVTEYIQGALEE